MTEIVFTRLPSARDLPAPERATDAAAGFDLRAAVDGELAVAPGERVMVPSGIALQLPAGYEGQVRPRSGLAWKQGLTVLNGPGTIDSDYRGEVKVLLVNLGQQTVRIERGDRIAQLIVHRLPEVELREADALHPSARGEGGFGHTGQR